MLIHVVHESSSPTAFHIFVFSHFLCFLVRESTGDKDGSKVTQVYATPGRGPDQAKEVSYTDIKVIGNGSFGVVYQAKLVDSGELVAIKKVLQDKRFKVRYFDHLFRTMSGEKRTGKKRSTHKNTTHNCSCN